MYRVFLLVAGIASLAIVLMTWITEGFGNQLATDFIQYGLIFMILYRLEEKREK